MHLFSFLIRRRVENINKRIQNLHTSIQCSELRSDFTSALQAYVPEADIWVEFPGPGAKLRLRRYGDEAPSFATVWRDLVEEDLMWVKCRGPPLLDIVLRSSFCPRRCS